LRTRCDRDATRISASDELVTRGDDPALREGRVDRIVLVSLKPSVCNHSLVSVQANTRINGDAKVIALKRTCLACPSQWEGSLADGRAVYARYRHGELTIGVGDDIDGAVRNARSDLALYAEEVGDGLDGFMSFEELKAKLRGVLKFPAGLVVENER
jgi:hypothetical protein